MVMNNRKKLRVKPVGAIMQQQRRLEYFRLLPYCDVPSATTYIFIEKPFSFISFNNTYEF